MITRGAAIFIFLVLMSACVETPDLTPQPSTTKHCADVEKYFPGTWVSSCEPSYYSSGTAIEWKKSDFVVGFGTISETVRFYNESECTSTPQDNLEVVASYEVGQDTNPDGYPYFEIDFTVTSVAATKSGTYPSAGSQFKRLLFMGNASSYYGLMFCTSTPVNSLSFTGVGSNDGVILGGETSEYPTTVTNIFFMRQ